MMSGTNEGVLEMDENGWTMNTNANIKYVELE